MIQPETIAGRKAYFNRKRELRTAAWVVSGDIVRIPLGGGLEAIIDVIDLRIAARFTWHAQVHRTKMYIEASVPEEYRTLFGRTTSLHRVVLGVGKGERLHVDHIDGNPLNCRRNNLRKATPSQNASNRHYPHTQKTPYRGVIRKTYRRWGAQIEHNGKNVFLGAFDTPEEAALAYNKAAEERFGEFAILNTI